MKVLMITGDARMMVPGTEANARYLLQKAQVDELKVVVWSPRRPLALFSVLGQALTRRFDVVTSQDPLWRGLLGLVAARLGGARLQVQLHADIETLDSIGRMLAGVSLKHAGHVRAVSERIKSQAEALGTRAFVDVLPVFVDLESVRAARPADLKKEFPQFGKVVLFVGRLEQEKSPADALDVFAQVTREFPGAGFVVAGEGSQRQMLAQKARDLGIGGKVVFLGYRADIPSLYKAAHCMLVTSLTESWGAAMVEALAVGLPVVAPDVGVAREAGARVAARPELAAAVLSVLKSGERGVLHLPVLSRDEWARRWRETLN